MMHQEQVNHILQGLRAKTEDAKLDAAKELHIFVTSELQEDATVEIFDLIDQQIYSMLSSPHSSDHKGAILAINALIGAEIGNKNIKTSRFANYLKNQVPSTDQTVRVLTAQVIAKLVLVSGFLDFGEHEMLHAFEWLEDKNEGRRHAGVLLICELSAVMPTFFYQHINKFFDAILLVLWDSKSHIREDAASALRQALAIMAYREKKDKHLLPSGWYEQCFKQAAAEFEDAIGSLTPKEKNAIRDNRVHGALLVFNELLRLSNSSFEEERDALLQAHAAFSCIRQDRWRRDMRVVGSSSRRFPPTSSTAIASPNSSRALRQFHSHRRSGSATTPFLSPLRSQPDAALLLSAALVSGPDNDRYPFLPAGMGGKFLESTVCTDVVKHHYDIICQRVVAQKGNKNSFVQSTFLLLIPRLAAFNKRRFRDNHLEEILTHLLSLLKRERIPAAFAALGLTAVALGEDITPHLSQIVEVIRFCLPSLAPVPPPSSRRKTTSTSSLVDNHADPSVVACLAQVCHAVGPSLRDDVKELLKPCLKLGLSSVLTASLKEIAVQIPELKQLVSENLLTILSTILTAAPECSPESSSSLRSPTPPTSPSSVALIFGPSGEGHGPQLGASEPANIVLALKTLSTFDFEARSLLPYVDLLANDLTSSSHKSIRQEALRACTRILQPNLSLAMSSQTVFLKISDAVKKLLRAGLTDTDPDIRLCTLECLQEPFDTHLAQAECISLLFMAKHDQVFEIREHALCALGRLSTRNPALVMPKLRITLIQLLSELEFSLGRSREQAASLLGRLVSYSPALIEPYIEGILTFLTPRLKEGDCNPAVISKILLCIGELAQVNGAVIERHEKALYPILIEMIQDSSAGQKRLMALWTLGQVVQSTGKVVEPYLEYPHLTDILLVILKTENTLRIRRETIRVLGLLGALDPYRAVSNKNEIDPHCMADDETDSESQADMTTNEMLVSMNVSSNSLDEFYPAVTLSTVTRILRDPSQAQQNVVQAISFTFKSIGLKCVPYLPQVLPPLLNLIRTGDPPFKEFLFQHLGKLISIVGQHIRNYVDGIFALIIEFWNISGTYGSPQSDRMRGTIINLLEQIYGALGSEFKVYMPKVLPLILKTLQTDSSKDRSVTLKLLQTLSKCAPALESYLHMLLPPIVRLTETSDCSNQVRKQALDTITDIAGCLDLTEYPSTLIHPLVRVLDHQPELRNAAMEVLCSLGVQLGHRFQLFVPLIARAITRNKINHQKYEHLVSWIKKNDSLEDLPMFCRPRLPRTRAGDSDSDATPIKDKGIVLAALRNAWKVNRQASKEDWIVWLHRLSTELLKASPSPSLRACIALIPHYPMILRDLFNAAFVSCWLALDETSKSELMSALEVALAVQDVPELTQTILNLAEFMEHCDKGPLPLDPTLLGKHAMAVQAYAKALHYKEAEFHRQPTKTTETVGALISINHKLQQKEAAAGLLSFAMRNLSQDLRVEEKWYEKLHDWESALEAYQRKQELSPDDPSLTLGQMRCLQALGEWTQLYETASAHWPTVDAAVRREMAGMASSAAWGLGQWEAMREYSLLVPMDTTEGAFFRAVLAVQKGQYLDAQRLIDLARDLIDSELTSMISESYQRGYETLVTVVMLSELEEAVMYKLVPKKRSMIKWIWSKRLEGCRRSVEDWQRLLQVRSLVLSPREDMQTWLKFASLCRKSGRPLIADKTLMMLRECTKNDPVAAAKVTYASTKLMWSSNRKADALKELGEYVGNTLQTMLLPMPLDPSVPPAASLDDSRSGVPALLARCLLRLGDWHEQLHGMNDETIPIILKYYNAAKKHDNNWYTAWHAWALCNFKATLLYQSQAECKAEGTTPVRPQSAFGSETSLTTVVTGKETPQYIVSYGVPAIQGFFRSIALSHGSSLQDTLRLLTLWFDYGEHADVYDALLDGLRTLEINTWLQVIPQIIARIDITKPLVARMIHQLLMDIGKAHPQALVYPLTVASKSGVPARSNAANQVLQSMREHSATLVHQAMMVSDELIRVAILWNELWHEGLDEASRLYFGPNRNIPAMLATLEPFHAMMERGPQTQKERSFYQTYGRDLADALECCQRYKKTHNIRELNAAWDLYYQVFRRITRQLTSFTSFELQYVSPVLLESKNLELAVPGTYVPHRPSIRIAHVHPSLQVFSTKQRPRKLVMRGSNGRDFTFLLKGHEDLRQDERVMQLFGLVNTLLMQDPETQRRNLTIQRYAVIPLSTSSGLIGWVPHCDTLHSLIRDYRDKKRIIINLEHRIMLRMYQGYDQLTLMQKVEIFEHALEHSTGDDLAKLLWLKSPSSEVWFEKRCNYTRSLAVMSMVGYVLGLGDRHPSNLMLDRVSGRIIHIDFGDCFEVAMGRERFPEKIPFRLTRMLINAMEVTGIEGTFRTTCEKVMAVLRKNKDSLMAVLEAFVHDPLLNWRLIDNPPGGFRPDVPEQYEALNRKAIQITNRVRDKLSGTDFDPNEKLEIHKQVSLLIQQATCHANLAQCYIGWCPFW